LAVRRVLAQTVADWLVRFLEKQKIDFVFSHPGGPVLPVYDAMRRLGAPKNVLVRHEGAGSFMADAYAKVTGRVGVCMSTMGPGAANLTIGVGTAFSDSTPVLALTGQLGTGVFGRGYQQETNHRALFAGITKGSFRLDHTSSAPETIERAYRLAVSGRQGPVHIDMPVDTTASELGPAAEPTELTPRPFGPPPPELVAEACKLVRKATAPIILAGGGVVAGNASNELTAFAEALGIPVATSYNGRGSIPESHLLSVGRAGENTPSYSRDLLNMADLLIAVGYRFTDVSTEGWKPANGTKLIQIDCDATEIGKNAPVTIGLVGNSKYTLPAMLDQLTKEGALPSLTKKWVQTAKDEREKWWHRYSSVESSDALPIKPQRVMKELSAFVTPDAIVAAGAGRAKMWAASVLPIRGPRTWIHSGGYAVMGYELPAALACKLARPEARVFAIAGDASFQMHCQELATAVEYEAPFVTVVLNDKSLGSIRNLQMKRYGKTFGTEFSLDVDLSQVAKAFGGEGTRVTRAAELAPLIDSALRSDKPTVLDVVVDGGELPTFNL
jgi:acetolactate synthase I/II/III large subunit